MGMLNMCVGGTTDTRARFVAKVDNGPVRIAYDTDPGMGSPAFSASTAVDAQGVAKVEVAGLTANTRYHWQVEDNGVLDTSATGQLITHPVAPGNPASFTVALAGDAGQSPSFPGSGSELAPNRISNHPAFDTIRTRALAGDWLAFIHLGDLHYYDFGTSQTDNLTNRRRSYDDILAQSRQHQLYRELPWVYTWDDHCYDGNNADGSYVDKAVPQQVYRERVPHYDLPGSPATAGLELDGANGDYATTPDHASLDITGDLEMAAEAIIDDWTAAAPDGTRATFAGKWDSPNRSYFFGVENDGRLSLFWSTDGSNSELRFSTAAVPVTTGRLAVRATLDVDNGAAGHTVTFYTATTIAGPWTQLGDPVVTAGTTSIFSGTAEGSVGAVDGGTGRPFAGTMRRVEVRDGIDGTVVADPDLTGEDPATASFNDDQGLTWTVNGDAEIVAESGDGPIYHSFQIGRVLFVVWDVRTDRSPNSATDDAAKTMLGAGQKSWMDTLLAGTSAQFIVVVSASQWLGTVPGGDGWRSFETERAELLSMFDARGFLDRMCMVCADTHVVAIDSGTNEHGGGIPVFQFAPLDASGLGFSSGRYDLGPTLPGRHQYGTLDIRDDGGTITVTGTGYRGTAPLMWHTVTAGGKTRIGAGNPSHVVAL